MQKTKVAFCRLFVEHPAVHHESSTTRSEIDPAGDAGADSYDDDALALRAALRASHSGSVSGLRSGPGIVRMMLPWGVSTKLLYSSLNGSTFFFGVGGSSTFFGVGACG